ncbi:MAG: RecQ family ATP-dependent DNA helicase [Chloroflexi bacterium]|nr:RecQ family ATP-dependent DNA helicase [Chloroflexota bacterium]
MREPFRRLQLLTRRRARPQEGIGELRGRGLALLRQALDDPVAEFREGQWEAIEQIAGRRARLLMVERTGWGKSLVYFLATRLLRDRDAGPTLLISPLLSLMRNQILAAGRLGIRAATINSSNADEWESVRSRLRADALDVLLVAPERLANDEFREEVLLPVAGRVGLFVVDEAHCISDWGHDFRPDYRRIARILQLLPRNVPVLATTATANDRVVEDVLATLGSDVRLVRGPLARRSLRLQNIRLAGQAERMAWLAEQLPRLPGSGIVYTLTIRDAQQVAAWLQTRGIDARAYWGGLEAVEREMLEERLLSNRIKALVATTALGMGFDKPDLGFVVHFQRPGSVVHYYQQVGRAGRAMEEAFGILLGGEEDREITEYFIRAAFPPEAHVEEVLNALRAAKNGLSTPMLEREVNLSRGRIEKVLKSLVVKTPAPVARRDGRWYVNPVRYKPDRDKIERLTRIRHAEQERMTEYMQSRECLMRFLARELDDPRAEPCGRCAVCCGGPFLPETASGSLIERAVEFLRRGAQRVEPRRSFPPGALTIYGWRGAIPERMRLQPGRALCVWGDDGWGQLVRRGKQVVGRFDDALVTAAASLIRTHWRPQPAPRWVTCVPSLNHPTLVPDFAQRLAQALRLPFAPCIRKVRPTEPQKAMENSYRQAHNLEGAFEVIPWTGLSGPVLLVDDMVDSGWTFTVIGGLLREAGSGLVFPLALAVTTKRSEG